jgi:hypothetical protein
MALGRYLAAAGPAVALAPPELRPGQGRRDLQGASFGLRRPGADDARGVVKTASQSCSTS